MPRENKLDAQFEKLIIDKNESNIRDLLTNKPELINSYRTYYLLENSSKTSVVRHLAKLMFDKKEYTDWHTDSRALKIFAKYTPDENLSDVIEHIFLASDSFIKKIMFDDNQEAVTKTLRHLYTVQSSLGKLPHDSIDYIHGMRELALTIVDILALTTRNWDY